MENMSMKNWTTWEELLLSCAVKRHGFNDWYTVATEIKSRTSLPHDFITANNCKLKYLDLKRHYASATTTATTAVDDNLIENDDTLDDDDDDLPWIEQLRNLRVAELRQEVHRYDDSILSLQLKVKKLEEEREQSVKLNDEKTDLHNNDNGSENDVKDREIVSEKYFSAKIDSNLLAADDGFNRRDESVNGSNSTSTTKGESQYFGLKQEEKTPAQSGSIKPDLDLLKRAVACDSLGENSDASMAKESGLNASYELRESVDEWNRLVDEETRDSSNVRSATNLTRRKNAGGRNVDVRATLTISGAINEIVRNSQHLVGVMELIQSHKHGSLFEHRLKIQENDKYDNIVRQHMDLHTIEKRLQQGYYSSCTSKFYRDLLLIFNNAIVYFPKFSIEYISAFEIRNLVNNEISKQTQRSCSTEPSLSLSVQPESKPDKKRPESLLLAKHKSSTPIVVCRKRSSISSKSNSRKSQTQSQENKSVIGVNTSTAKSSEDLVLPEQSSVKNDDNDYTVSGTRSPRRNKSNGKDSDNIPISDKNEAPKNEKEKEKENEIVSSTKKRGGAADFLKRIKESSPLEKSKSPTSNTRITRQRDAKAGGCAEKNRTENKKKQGIEDKVVRRSSKQVVEEEINPFKRNLRPPRKSVNSGPVKRKREAEASTSKQPQKRSKI